MPKMICAVALLVVCQASAAMAQPATARVQPVASTTEIGYLELNIGLQATSTSFDATIHPLENAEPGTVHTTYNVSSGSVLDFGGGVNITPSFAVGASYSRFARDSDAAVDAQVPHPFFFNRPRAVSGTASGLTRSELAFHIRAVWMPAMSGGWKLAIFGGPSFFKVGQDVVEDVTVDQTYPFDTATFKDVVATRHDGSGIGFNAGVDLTRLFTPHVGVGVAGSFARAKIDLDTGANTTQSVDAGGARIAGGLRFRF